ncbi:PaaX family transcriptional regulator C-terminal domain-containing protein [Streptomyces sp. NPDC087440]|uniref:PaaX family transcriptional regulator n=1 Tax=Streptomyces sp. NPDC087440 TaxID=3365790 RepID=UPI0037FDD865
MTAPSVPPRTRRRADGSPSARTLLLTVLGEYVRYAGREKVWSRAVVGALCTCGTGEATARRAVTRLAQEGWLRTEASGRYARLVLTPRLTTLLTAWTRRLERAVEETPWHGEWQQLLLRVPPEEWRDRALVEQQLGFEGFGPLGGGLWVAADAGGVGALKGLLREQGLSERAMWCVTRAGDEADERRLLATAWDLDAVRRAHEDFLKRFTGASAATDEEAFVLRTRLVHAWRLTFERDPRLPGVLLPGDWPGREATELFVSTWRGVAGPAGRYWESRLGAGRAA